MRYFSSEAVSHYPQKTAEMEIDLNRNSNLTLARYADNPQVWIKNTRLISIVFRVCTIQFSSLLNLVNKMIKKSISTLMFPIQKNFMITLVLLKLHMIV